MNEEIKYVYVHKTTLCYNVPEGIRGSYQYQFSVPEGHLCV